jgi:hypothetical protein
MDGNSRLLQPFIEAGFCSIKSQDLYSMPMRAQLRQQIHQQVLGTTYAQRSYDMQNSHRKK